MKKNKLLYKIPIKFALKLVLAILATVFLFHLLILFRIIPYKMIWATKFDSVSHLWLFEWISIFVTVLFFVIFAIKSSLVKSFLPVSIVNFFIWCITIFYFVNTILILISGSSFEKLVFMGLSLLMFVLSMRIAIYKAKVKF